MIISPNPSNGLVNITFPKNISDQIEVRILNNLGKIVYDEKISINKTNLSFDLNLENIDPGIYFIVIIEKQIILTEKIIIR